MYKLFFNIFALLLRLNIIVIDSYQLHLDMQYPILWIDDNNIIVNSTRKSYLYNIIEREEVEKYERKENQVFGYDEEVVYCEWRNREINSIDEYSTHLVKKNITGDVLLDIEFKPTVYVLECGKKIILKTVPPIEERYYLFSDKLYEIDNYSPKMISSNHKYFFTLDNFNNYWINSLRVNLFRERFIIPSGGVFQDFFNKPSWFPS